MVRVQAVVVVFTAVACLCILPTKANNDDHGVDAVSYTAEQFLEEVPLKPHFVMFFAPWCGHCKRLAPTWDELAKIYNNDEAPVVIAKVDCTDQTKLCSDNEVAGYPTLKFFINGDVDRYKSGRDLDSLQLYVDSKLTEPEAVEEPPEAAEPEKALVELDDAGFSSHIEHGSHFIKFYAPWCGHCQKLAPTWDGLAESFQYDEKVSVAKVDCTKNRATCEQFAVKGYPTLLWFANGEKVDKYQGSRELGDLKNYVTRMLSKENPDAYGTQEKVPEERGQLESQVVALTDETFDGEIAEGAVFVKFYAPWCGHCKKLAPVWVELSKKFSSNEYVKIANIDCTEFGELCSKYDVRAYPTLLYFENGVRVGDYSGERDVDALYKYVLEKLPHDEL